MSPKVTLNRIRVKNFKRITDVNIRLNPITALVGCNASGKSSILQAAQFGVAVLQEAISINDKTKNVKFRQTVSYNDILFRPTGNFLDLRHGSPPTQKSGYSICYNIKCDKKKSADIDIDIRRGKNANIVVKSKSSKEICALLADQNNPASILTPGISGIPMREEWRTRAVVDAAAMHGDANLYLRNVICHLNERENKEPWEKFQDSFRKCFRNANIRVEHSGNKDRYVEVKIDYNGKEFTLDMAALGMLQVIQILAYAFFYEPPLLLLDEPDSHLHADGQILLCKALRDIVAETNTRIVLATHSPQLIQDLMDDNVSKVVWIDDGKVVSHRSSLPDYSLLMRLGALSLGDKLFDPTANVILLTEDALVDKVTALAIANGAPKNLVVHSYHSCGKIDAAREFARMLVKISPKRKVIIHRDRDFRTEEEVNFELTLSKQNLPRNVVEIFTPYNDVEHSFAKCEHLFEALEKKFPSKINENVIKDAQLEGSRKCQNEIVRLANKARDVIKVQVYDCLRKTEKDEWQKCKMPNKPPAISKFLSKDSRQIIPFGSYHGKTAMCAIESELHSKVGGRHDEFCKVIYSPTQHLKCKTWSRAFKYRK